MNFSRQTIAILIIFLGCFFSSCKNENSIQSEAPANSVKQEKNLQFDRIIFITIDTLRQDHLVKHGYFRDSSPFLTDLMNKGSYFENAFSASSHTAPSHTSMFTSLFPYEHQVLRNYDKLQDGVLNLSQILSEQGYEQAAVSAVKFLEGNVGFPAFDNSIDLPSAEFSRELWYRNATVNIDRAINWIEKKAKPKKMFLWLHFYDVHEWDNLRNLPEKYHNFFGETDNAELVSFINKKHNIPTSFHGSEEKLAAAINRYDARLRYVDDEIKRFYEYLNSQGLNERTLWVITSDHGEGLGNHNYKGHGELLYQEQLKVPLLFYSSDKSIKPRAIKDLVRTVDLLPTFFNFTGYKNKKEAPLLQGLSLVPLITNGRWNDLSVRYSFAERRPKDDAPIRRNWEDGEFFSVHDLEEKYIFHSAGNNEFYDLQKDPFEERNLSISASNLKETFKNKVRQMEDFYRNNSGSPKKQKLNKQQYDELKTLGYM